MLAGTLPVEKGKEHEGDTKDETVPISGKKLIRIWLIIFGVLFSSIFIYDNFKAYQTRSYNSAAQADLRNAATAQEAYYVDESTYGDSVTDLTGASYGFYQSGNVTIATAGDTDDYTITAYHGSGDKTYCLTGPGGSVTAM